MKLLIVNGDDFGHSQEVNAGIVRAHREGILTSASLMVAGEARDDAARLARDHPSLDVGLHAVVCQGRSVLTQDELGALVDARGRFPNKATLTGLRLFFDGKLRSKLALELGAQIEKHLELVGYLNHVDGHLNFHVHPVIADILVELAVKYQVRCVRLPREALMTTLRLKRNNLPSKITEAVIFRALSRRTRKKMYAKGLRSTDWLFGLHQSGHLSEDYVIGVIGRLRRGVTELYFHPAMDVGGTPPSPAAQFEVEILTSPRVREALDMHGVRLTTFAELANASAAS